MIHERTETSFTDFRETRLGRWNQNDPSFVPQYAAFFCVLSEEKLEQQRSSSSFFQLVESFGASIAFFYLIFALCASRYNSFHFNAQVRHQCRYRLRCERHEQRARISACTPSREPCPLLRRRARRS